MEETAQDAWPQMSRDIMALRVVEKRFEDNGLEILEREARPGSLLLFAKDGGCLVVAEVEFDESEGEDFSPFGMTRSRAEMAAFRFLGAYDGEDARVRFDIVQLKRINQKRCIMKHTVNAFAES